MNQAKLVYFLLFAALFGMFAFVVLELNKTVNEKETTMQTDQINMFATVYAHQDEEVIDYCETVAPVSNGDLFEEYLSHRDVPKSIDVGGEKLKANEVYAAQGCQLVYGDQLDVPKDVQLLSNSSFQYIGYDKNGNLYENPSRKN